ncbi:MAG: hypothetical protein JRE64_02655 [Deltaproteobacteria bacterium]|nr:hypothetical protein [Deltaproteobacteria bacterium]
MKRIINKIYIIGKNALVGFLAFAVLISQSSCTTTKLSKGVNSHKLISENVEKLEHLGEVESITQYIPKISFWGPVTLVLTLGLVADACPWYKSYRIVSKSKEAVFHPDGSLDRVEEKNGFLDIKFKSPISMFYSRLIDQSRDALWDFFYRRSERDFDLQRRGDPYRSLHETVSEKLEKYREVSMHNLNLVFSRFQIEEVDFKYILTIRRPDGTIEKEFEKSYNVNHKRYAPLQKYDISESLL